MMEKAVVVNSDAQDPRERLWNLLNSYEDYIDGGFGKEHGTPPVFPEIQGGAPDDPCIPEIPGRAGVSDDRQAELVSISDEIRMCRNCRLCEQRTNPVPGIGVLDPLVMVVGEGPGEDEDAQGLPFVGRAGQYLDKWLEAIGLSRRSNAYIANIVKCRPPKNRDPEQEEISACLPYLKRQIELIQPKLIFTVGRISTQTLTGRSAGIGSLRGSLYTFQGIPLVPTYHPSGVLRNPDLRRAVWDDLKILKIHLDRSTSEEEV